MKYTGAVGGYSLTPVAVLVHVPNVKLGLEWYQKAFPKAQVVYLVESDFAILDIDGFAIEVVQADEKVAAGKAGTVLYWAVADVEGALERFLALGCRLYRGPLPIENGLFMCQVEDPFGNLIGLRGGV